MSPLISRLIFWIPRLLTVAYALFLSMFAMDVFQENRGLLDLTFALFMHLIPTWLLLVTLWISWRREWIAAVIYGVLAIVYVVWAWGRFPFSVYVTIDGPLLALAAFL